MIIKSKLLQIFAVDLRSLAIMRVGVGFLLVLDCLLRMRDLSAHYTDSGVFSREAIFQSSPFYLSIYSLNGSEIFVTSIFILQIFFGFLLMIGFKTRLCSIISWILYLSVWNRNPFINSNGDLLFNMVLFWGIFLPWNLYFSVDSAFKKTAKTISNKVVTIGTSGYFIQILIMYLFSGLHKLNWDWVIDGSGVYYTLKYIPYQQPLGTFMLQFPAILKFLSYATIVFELLAPLLLLIPYKNGLSRTLTILALITMHLFFGFAIELGLFSWIVIVSLSGLLPSFFWDKIWTLFSISKQGMSGQRTVTLDSNFLNYRPINAALCGLIIYVIIINILGLTLKPTPEYLNIPLKIIGFYQKWDLFSPPPKTATWILAEGVSNDKQVIKIIGDKDKERSNNYPNDYLKNHRWKKLANYIATSNRTDGFADYLCRTWKLADGSYLSSVLLYRHESKTQLNGSYQATNRLISKYECEPNYQD